MRRWGTLVLGALVLSACVAETVERRRPRKGPVKEVGYVDFGGGHVRYSSEGWSWIVSSRRRTALKLMARNCGKELQPRVLDEYAREDADAKYSEENVATTIERGDEHYVVERYVHISYDCRPKGWVEPAVSTGPARAPVLVIPAVPAPHAPAVDVTTASFVAPVSTPTAPSVPLSTSTIPSPESRP